VGTWTRLIGVAVLVATSAPATVNATSTLQANPPSEVFAAFNSPPPSDPADPCRTGARFKHNSPGDHDDITVCTFDSSGAPVATEASSHSLEWSIAGASSDEPIAVRFNPSPPPGETTGPAATAVAGIDALQAGRNTVTVTLLNDTGGYVDSFFLEKEVVGGGCAPATRAGSSRPTSPRSPVTSCRDVATKLTARAGRTFVRGRVQSEPECKPERNVTLFRRRRGRDQVIGTDMSNSLGRWAVNAGRLDGTYYARVPSSGATDAETGGTVTCLPDQSGNVRS
jgi:hypothetical protein